MTEINTAMIDTKVEITIETTVANPKIGTGIDKTIVHDLSQEKADTITTLTEEVHRDNDTITTIGTPNTLDDERRQEITDKEATQETATTVATIQEVEANRLINRQTTDEPTPIRYN